ncbi:glycosyltransferase [Flavobacterium pallidum]|nr:glycosyltransferase [Flavobacterium pallidum]
MRPKVSCHIITYNQKDYISKCIDSVLMQERDFSIEIVIGDDNSSDGTREILLHYQKQYPDLIRLNLRERRGGGIPGKENFLTTLTMCTGEYIALCDGDDYWSDPAKLRKQVAFLDTNPDYVLHSGNAIYLAENNPEADGRKLHDESSDQTVYFEDFLSKNNLITCTVMFRNIPLQYPEIFMNLTFGDWFTYVMLLKESGLRAYKSAQVLSTYRLLQNSVMTSLSQANYFKKHILQIKAIHQYTGRPLAPKEKEKLNDYYYSCFKVLMEEKKISTAILSLADNIKTVRFSFPYRQYAGYLKLRLFSKSPLT